jgi:hypothetical protein
MVKQALVTGLLLPGLLAPASAVYAQAAPATKSPAAPPAEAAKKEEEKPDKDIDETVKGYEKIDGVFTLYRKKKGTSDSLMMEVSEKQLGKLYLLQTTASTGLTATGPEVFQGQPLNDQPFRLQLVDDSRILVVQPNIDFRSPGDPVMQRALDKNYPAALLASLEIKARQKSRGTYLIDVGELFRGDIAEVGPNYLGEGPGSYVIEKPSAYVDSLKMFPENLVVRTMYRLNRVGNVPTGPRSMPFAVSYNFSVVPESGYVPRIADERVGYFLNSFSDVSDNSSYNRNVNFIQRWRLEKADPTLALSPPKKPIKWYISNTVPVKYRDSVRQGMLMYNKAFEAIGIKDAIVVEQMPDDADWDIADVRYNIIRWTDGNPFAIALFRSNPYTGEILNAAINFDSGFASGGASQFDVTVDPSKLYGAHFPEVMAAKQQAQRRLPRGMNSQVLCQEDYLQGAAQSAQFGMTALSLLDTGTGIPFNKEEFIKQYVTEVTAHEFGHCLGLRHNYIASTQFSMKELQNADIVNKNGVTSTVMEYTPFNLAALKQKNTPYYSPVVGSYDMFAIEYGYKPLGAATYEAEKPQLAAIASKSGLPGHAWMGDGMANAFDPAIVTFDLSKEPLEYVSRSVEVSRYLMGTLDTRLPKKGQSYYDYTRSYLSLMNQYLGSLQFATRYVGGMRMGHSRKGDPNEKLPLLPIDNAKQKEALNLVNTSLFTKNSLTFTRKGMAKLTANPNQPYFEGDAESRRYPMRNRLSSFQRVTLQALFSPSTLDRIANNEYRSTKPGDTLTLATLYRTIGTSIWTEVASGAVTAEMDPLRRDLQRAHLDLLINTVTNRTPGVPRDAVSLSWEQLRTLRGQIAKALPTAQGEYGKPHLNECLMRIDRVLKANAVVAN